MPRRERDQPLPRAPLASALAALVLITGVSASARAAQPNADLVCEEPSAALDKYHLLRAMSLDLRGELPSEVEYAALDDVDGDDVPEALVDDWLASDAFVERAVRLHRDLLWNSLDNITLVNPRGVIRQTGGIWYRSGTQAIFYRGGNVRCLDAPAEYADDGTVVAWPQADGTRREGWIAVAPFWAPAAMIKTCAFDAQDAAISPSGTTCASNAGLSDSDCGCGPELRNCMPTGTANQTITRAMGEDLERRVRDVIAGDGSYLDLFTSRTAWVNGPLVHYWRYLRAFPRMTMDPAPLEVDRLPDLAWEQADTWVPVEMGPEQAGILTSPAYLLRFQTNRARANRFYNAFLCQPFNAPSGGLPVASAAAQIEPDLQVRDGCDYCHAVLEPAAAHWGRWGERGATYLSPDTTPAFDPSCELCATTGIPCSSRCRTFYVTDVLDEKAEPFVGWMSAYLFRRPEHEAFVEDGPTYLVYKTVVDGRFPACVARTAAERLLGREVGLDEQPWLDGLAREFVASGYRYRDVVRAVVMNPAYRRVR